MTNRYITGLALLALLLLPIQGKAQMGPPGYGSTCGHHFVHSPCTFIKIEGLWQWVDCDPYLQLGCKPAPEGTCFEALAFPFETMTVYCYKHNLPCEQDQSGGVEFPVQVPKLWCDLLAN